MTLAQIASSVTAVGVIGGGALALDHLHVAAADFEQYIEQQLISDEREYVRKIKQDIRDINIALQEHPGDEYLVNELAGLLDELCDIRPEDRLCED